MNPESNVVTLISVNVAEPEIIGLHRGKTVPSAIRKRPVTSGGSLTLTRENLSGDRQADLRVHGGPDKAVYVYPTEHLPLWNTEFSPDTPYGPGSFGENLTIAGLLESDARIGDIWSWGDALLQICQPRYPCYKLAIATDRKRVAKRMLETGRNGWYLRVLRPGEVPVSGPITVIERGPHEATILDAVHALLPRSSRELIERVARVDALASNWRDSLLATLAAQAT